MSAAVYRVGTLGRRLETAGAWLLGALWILPLAYAFWTAFHAGEFSTRLVLSAPLTLVVGDTRRQRDGVNYGLGLRYDLTQALGLRVEYSRFNRFNGDAISAGLLPESDQVTLGVQFKF